MRRYSLILALAAVAAMQASAGTLVKPRVYQPGEGAGLPKDVFKEGFYGTWTTGDDKPLPSIYIFFVDGDKLSGVACGPCGDLNTLYEIGDGAIVNGNRATFYLIDSGTGSPSQAHTREEVRAVVSDGVLTVTRKGMQTEFRRPQVGRVRTR